MRIENFQEKEKKLKKSKKDKEKKDKTRKKRTYNKSKKLKALQNNASTSIMSTIESVVGTDNKIKPPPSKPPKPKKRKHEVEEGEIDDGTSVPIKKEKLLKKKSDKLSERPLISAKTEGLYIDKSIDTELPADIFTEVNGESVTTFNPIVFYVVTTVFSAKSCCDPLKNH